MTNQISNFDPAELAKFSALADRWWDPQREFRPLHQINPVRLERLRRCMPWAATRRLCRPARAWFSRAGGYFSRR